MAFRELERNVERRRSDRWMTGTEAGLFAALSSGAGGTLQRLPDPP